MGLQSLELLDRGVRHCGTVGQEDRRRRPVCAGSAGEGERDRTAGGDVDGVGPLERRTGDRCRGAEAAVTLQALRREARLRRTRLLRTGGREQPEEADEGQDGGQPMETYRVRGR